MFLTQRYRNAFLTATLVIVLGTIVLISGCQPSFAASLTIQSNPEPIVWVVATDSSNSMIDQARANIKSGIERLTNKVEQKAADEVNQMETKTRAAINTSISNPDYQPQGKSKEANRQDQKALEGMENKVKQAYN
ncbi:hypothetical protein RIF25_07835 [Thermosynechococcaceae cyanobacterium BACA0444]|uniref:Lipoprotein n=1 Tax=Pseudocalidococcus azoricus BACA0444 TaxID=2918990 RepID=A0AAE4FSF5_9CYAN|nr:hypothetical protein [Pseudocalidococcus azoricus]MDS3860722.1 hypothetical protein [Pseudocalidococcus azoricus BACA0444]